MINILNNIKETINILQSKKRILFILTSNRGANDTNSKSKQLAEKIASKLNNVKIIDATALTIYPCEGNVSAKNSNICGIAGAKLEDENKNPSGQHRCWTSLHHNDDELWQISKELLQSDCVIFFGSVRWGQMNGIYQKLIERLTWLENRHTTLGEENIIKNISAGIIAIGHNWRVDEIIKVEKQVLDFFGFSVVKELCWGWQFTKDAADESQKSYQQAAKDFAEILKEI